MEHKIYSQDEKREKSKGKRKAGLVKTRWRIY
jgi:hypothetical protein